MKYRKLLSQKIRSIAVDFDGCLCANEYPNIGAENVSLFRVLRRCKEEGKKVILWTCREGYALDVAIAFCGARGLEFDEVNNNLPENIAYFGNNCRKVNADIYVDDKAYKVKAL